MVSPMSSQSFQVNGTYVIFRGNGVFFHNCGKRYRRRSSGLRKFKTWSINITTESNDVNSFSILRNTEVLWIQHLGKYLITKIFQRLFYCSKSATTIMNFEAFHVLAKNDCGFMLFTNCRDIKEQGSSTDTLVIIIETHSFTSQRERLAWKASQTNIKCRNLIFCFLKIDVAVNLTVRIIC